MKPSSGRAPSIANRAATLAATVFATAGIGLAACLLPTSAALAQTPAKTTDGTPDVDASIAQKNWNEALKQLDARLATNPRDVQAKFKRGTVLARLNRDDEAIAVFTELTQAYPELPEPYNNLAALYAKAGRYDEARVALETATRANPGYALAYDNLGDLYLRLAGVAYKRAQALGSKSALTSQRAADIQKVLSPAPKKRAVPTAVAPTQPVPSDQWMPLTPPNGSPFGGAFGGPSGSLPTSPYVVPNTQP
jgi:tetratricopeptide (TPR) repeat protein